MAMTQPFEISIKMGDTILYGKGTTALEALQSIERPTKIIQKSIFTISHGNKRKEILFTPVKMRRIFFPSAQPILIKWLAAGLK